MESNQRVIAHGLLFYQFGYGTVYDLSKAVLGITAIVEHHCTIALMPVYIGKEVLRIPPYDLITVVYDQWLLVVDVFSGCQAGLAGTCGDGIEAYLNAVWPQ
jgi:hypothetical protein